MANSYVEYPTSGTGTNELGQKVFAIPFKYIAIADVEVKGYNGSIWTDLTIAATDNTAKTVELSAIPSSYTKIRLWRNTSTTQLVDFQNGSRLSESDLDTAYQQGLFVAQEVSENASTGALSKGDQGIQGIQGPAGTNGADAIDSNGEVLVDTIKANTSDIVFNTNSTERMRIDASGNVLVGKTTGAFATAGTKITSTGNVEITAASDGALALGRTGSDGYIQRFYKDSALVGTIGNDGANMYIGKQSGLQFQGNDIISPNRNGVASDNTIDLGQSSARFDDIYATNGTIQTSDFNEKQDIAPLTATEMLVGKRISALFKTFRWKDSVAENGDNARTHTGVIAQDVQAAFTAEGLDAGDYALFISSTWFVDDEGNEVEEGTEGATSKTRMGIRYPELLSFVAAYNEQRFASIEARLTALEA